MQRSFHKSHYIGFLNFAHFTKAEPVNPSVSRFLQQALDAVHLRALRPALRVGLPGAQHPAPRHLQEPLRRQGDRQAQLR